MSGNTFGTIFRVTTFGESHGAALGCVIDGCPAGIQLDMAAIQAALDRRKPGQSKPASDPASSGTALNAAVTSRKEPDQAELLSGVFEGTTTGTPIAMVIRNTSQHSQDYSNIKDVYRPGHADYTYSQKYGIRDYRGGGRSSGRETAARVAAGAVASQVLAQLTGNGASGSGDGENGPAFSITAYTIEAAGIACTKRDLSVIEQNSLRACDPEAAELMQKRVAELREKGDSAGGIVECVIRGVPAGLGEPVFDKLDAELAKAMLSIGAVKGIEFGAGFEAARMTGSVNNDSMRSGESAGGSTDGGKADRPRFVTNNAGGILGGMSNGNDIIFRIAVKPVPSIRLQQQTVDRYGNDADISIEGRHDICLCPRIVPVVEAMTAMTLLDLLLRNRAAVR